MLRRIFIVGLSGAGKSTYARNLARILGCGVVSGGGWIRAQYPHAGSLELTQRALNTLAGDPDVAIRWVGPRPEGDFQIVEGLRNPRDFVHLCDPTRDFAVLLSEREPPTSPDIWESTGVDAIVALLGFYMETWAMQVATVTRDRDRVSVSPEDLAALLRKEG